MSSKKIPLPARKKSAPPAASGDFDALVTSIVHIHQQTQDFAAKAVNVALTLRNWLIGYRIVEFEQQGKDRATYGESLMDALALRLASHGLTRVLPAHIIRDPYVFEFLGLRSRDVMAESDLEDALLDRLQDFLLELGHGFCFEARQKRILSSYSPPLEGWQAKPDGVVR